jgi:hypothetical protein
VLKGIPISQIPSDNSTNSSASPPFKFPGDIRHVNKEMDAKLHKISKTHRGQFKREGRKPKDKEHNLVFTGPEMAQQKVCSPDIIEIGSPESEEKQDNIEQESETAVLDFNIEQLPRVRNVDLYKIDLNL